MQATLIVAEKKICQKGVHCVLKALKCYVARIITFMAMEANTIKLTIYVQKITTLKMFIPNNLYRGSFMSALFLLN